MALLAVTTDLLIVSGQHRLLYKLVIIKTVQCRYIDLHSETFSCFYYWTFYYMNHAHTHTDCSRPILNRADVHGLCTLQFLCTYVYKSLIACAYHLLMTTTSIPLDCTNAFPAVPISPQRKLGCSRFHDDRHSVFLSLIMRSHWPTNEVTLTFTGSRWIVSIDSYWSNSHVLYIDKLF